MHFYCLMRGQKDKLDRLINDLLAIYLPYKTGINDGEDIKRIVQLGVRPIQLYEIIYPKEHHNFMMRILHPTGSWNPKYDKYIKIIRKLLGLGNMPKLLDEKGEEIKLNLNEALVIRAQNQVEVVGIGVKDDRMMVQEVRELL